MKAEMNSNDFNRIISATKDFASESDFRKIHKYIRLEFSAADSIVTAVALDGYKLSAEHSVCSCDEDFVAYVNPNTHLPRNMDTSIELANGELIIRCGDLIFGCKQPSGEFLDWKSALPSGEPDFKIAFNGNYLLKALKAAKISCGSFKEPVILEFRGPLMPVIIRTNREDIKMVLPVRINGKQ